MDDGLEQFVILVPGGGGGYLPHPIPELLGRIWFVHVDTHDRGSPPPITVNAGHCDTPVFDNMPKL
ncbi:hypothetical protein [Micromonospora sp. NPDC005174]|uniref:hypothetical protein n=1 Tax=Micromonospora sp. NPDC005174 TaxID=3157018 RepID=UPI0033A81B45